MNQRRAATGRPLGTDGSDFSYRMVVDSRYTKVAKGKSRLKSLLVAQMISQVIGSLWVFSSALEGKEYDRFAVVSCSLGFISLLVGELGRRRSLTIFLRLYAILSSMAIAISSASIVRSDSFFKVIRYKDISVMTNYELVEVVRVLLGLVLQIPVIITAISLLHNMSPPKRSS